MRYNSCSFVHCFPFCPQRMVWNRPLHSLQKYLDCLYQLKSRLFRHIYKIRLAKSKEIFTKILGGGG